MKWDHAVPTWWAVVGSGFLLAGAVVVVAIAVSYPELPVSACTDVGYDGDEPPGGFQYYGFHWGWLAYSPDGGVNRCDTPIVTVAAGLLVAGAALFGVGRWRR